MRQMLATTIHESNTTPHHQDGATTTRRCVASKPNSVSGDFLPRPANRPLIRGTFVVHQIRRHYSFRIPHGSRPRCAGVSRGAP
jgi:hypothetical protein